MGNKNNKMIFNMIRNHWKSIIGIILGVGFATFLINMVIVSRMPFNLPIAEENDWIGFWGSVLGSLIGGFISVYVLYLTMKYNQTQIKNQRKMEIMPYLKYSLSGDSLGKNTLYLYHNGLDIKKCKEFIKSFSCSNELLVDETLSKWSDNDCINTYRQVNKASGYSNYKEFVLNIENLGLNNAIDLNIEKITFGSDTFYHAKDLMLTNNSKISNDFGVDVLKVNDTLSIQMGLCIEDDFYNDIDINIIIEYKDLLMTQYQQELELNCIYENKYDVFLNRLNIQKPIELKTKETF